MINVRYGNGIKKKYEKKKQYLIHYQLLEEYDKSKPKIMKINFFVFLGFYLFLNSYPLALSTIDFTITILMLLFFMVLKPSVLKGKVTAYYRRDYKDMDKIIFWMLFILYGAIIRFSVVAIYYAITFYLIRDDYFELSRYQNVVYTILWNPTMSLIGIGIFVVSIYVLFYHEKYVTVREFSNRIVEIYNNYSLTEVGAVKEFRFQKDKELELENINGVKYDKEWHTNTTYNYDSFKPEPVSFKIEENDNNNKKQSFEEKDTKEETASDTIRRRARR